MGKPRMFTGYKTFLAAYLMAAFGFLAQTDWVEFLNNPKAGLVAIFSGMVFAGLRAITTPPLSKNQIQIKRVNFNFRWTILVGKIEAWLSVSCRAISAFFFEAMRQAQALLLVQWHLFHWRIAFPYSGKTKRKPAISSGLPILFPNALLHAIGTAAVCLYYVATC